MPRRGPGWIAWRCSSGPRGPQTPAGDTDRALALVEQALRLVDPVVDPVRAGLLHERRGVYLW
jgi:hypothetical protein